MVGCGDGIYLQCYSFFSHDISHLTLITHTHTHTHTQGETKKRAAPTPGNKTRKRARVTKVLNTHLDSSILKDYSETEGKNS